MQRTPLRRTRRGIALMDAIVGGMILAIGVGTVMSITSRSIRHQVRGEKRIVAGWLADDLLNMVLTEGPVEYPRIHDTAGVFDAPFGEYEYELTIEDIGRGLPYRVTAAVYWGPRTDQVIEMQALIADRLGDEPNEPREPEEEVDRDARWYDEEEEAGDVG